MNTNPYQSPNEQVDEPVFRDVDDDSVPFVAFLITAIFATAFTWVAPLLSIPAALLLTPAVLRTSHIRQSRLRRRIAIAGSELISLFARSIFAVIPVAIGSYVAFGCIFAPAAWLSFSVIPAGAEINQGRIAGTIIFAGLGILIGTWLALLFGRTLLRRWKYLSMEIIREQHQRRTASSHQSHPKY